MSLKKLSIALGVVFALSAVMASSAFASATTPTNSFWYVGKTKLASGESREVKCSAATNFVLTSEVLGVPIEIVATGISCAGAKIEQNGTMAEDSGKLTLTGTKMVKPAGCTVPETLVTNELKTKIEEEGTTVYDLFEPGSGANGVFFTLPIGGGCALEGNQPIEGTFFGRWRNVTNALAKNQPLTFSATIDSAAGGTLNFAGEPMSLSGTANNELASGAEFKANKE